MPEPFLAVAPPGEPGSGLKIVAVLAVFALLLGGAIFWLSTKDTIHFSAATNPAPPRVTVSEPLPPLAVPGDCVALSGSNTAPGFRKVECGKHNYTVASVTELPDVDEKCDAQTGGYARYTEIAGLRSVQVCLIPVLVDGECYDVFSTGTQAALPKTACGGPGAVRVKVLANTADKAACGPGVVMAFSYPETKTTNCFFK
ncbi:LppU/SCO3897 family protein [Lentzea sp.]|uniref:LppU/SCO3897 family protein n=1 Tax=Lentzea sp. TaxID=56099 RepID=UPI002ED60ADA